MFSTKVLKLHKENQLNTWVKSIILVQLFIEENDPKDILVYGKRMWTSEIISAFEWEIRARCFKQWNDNQGWLESPVLFKEQNSGYLPLKSDLHDTGLSVCHCLNKTAVRTSQKQLMLTRLEKTTELFPKNLDFHLFTACRLCLNGGNSTTLLFSPAVTKLKPRVRDCNPLGDFREPQGRV